MIVCAWTALTESYPEFFNATTDDESGDVVITVRGPATPRAEGGVNCGATISMRMPLAEFKKTLAPLMLP